MVLQQLASDIEWPLYPTPTAAPYTLATAVTVAASQFVAWVFQAREPMTISHVAWQTGAITAAPTAITSIETIDPATGFLGGLWPSSGASPAVAVAASTLAVHALSAAAVIATGELFAVKIAHGGTGTSFVVQVTSNLQFQTQIPYRVTNSPSGTVAKTPLANLCPIMALGNSASTFYYVKGCFPLTSFAVGSTFSNASTQARGVKFRVPFKCRCVGVWAHLHGAIADINVIMLDGSSTTTSIELGSTSTFFDGDKSGGLNTARTLFYFDNPITLYPNVDYRAVIEPTTSTSTNLLTAVAGDNYLVPCTGAQDFVYTSRSGTTWTDSATTFPLMSLVLDQLEDGGTRVIGG